MMNKTIDTNHMVIPRPEPGSAWGRALKGGYTVHPDEAGPDSMNSDANITREDAKKNQ